ncbi:MAG: hypothetical protein A2X86_00325 [Bdellovibrionales bacterium GWA2_49_15]|nr:MAG: hypothetical protein A2X86_00325 [Bdellovibrionales bacterium GWA2_49_15]HAZ14488.1 cytochrome oxidase [Bdellovibrionales bacterium]
MKKDSAAKFIILCSMLYLVLGMTMGIVVALKLIWPTIGDFALLSYGKIRVLHTNLILFGWLLQSGIGITLFILPRLLNTTLLCEKTGVAMGVLYNVAVLGGSISILNGGMKNIEYGEIPAPYDYMIAVCWVLFGINIFGTILRRKVKQFYVSVWYITGAVIWTTFVYISGNMITQMPFMAGINQANLQWFYVHNVVGLIFTPIGVAMAYYLIPKSLNTPLYSHKLSLVGFWVISFVYVWTGAHHMIHGPISYWLQTVAIICSWGLIIPVAAVITNFVGTYRSAPKANRTNGPVPKLLFMGTMYYLLTCLQGPFQAIRAVNVVVSKTDWVVGHAHMAVFGAFSFFSMAGVYYIIPRLMGTELFSKKLGDLHFWLMTISSIPFFAVLWIGGIQQGLAWLNPEITFLEALEPLKHSHIARFASGSLILISVLLFLYNIVETLAGKGKPLAVKEGEL